jgi:catechol 2,3-dioxygenase-like lactoylglutathione lyase family enzyme
MLTSIQIVNVPVADQSAAYEFYVELLGLKVVADAEMGPHGRALRRPRRQPVGAADRPRGCPLTR